MLEKQKIITILRKLGSFLNKYFKIKKTMNVPIAEDVIEVNTLVVKTDTELVSL